MSVTLVEAQEILSSFDDKLRSYTENIISGRCSMKIVKASVTEVTASHVMLNNGSRLPCGMVVWSTGLAPRSALIVSCVGRGEESLLVVCRGTRIRAIVSTFLFHPIFHNWLLSYGIILEYIIDIINPVLGLASQLGLGPGQ